MPHRGGQREPASGKTTGEPGAFRTTSAAPNNLAAKMLDARRLQQSLPQR